MKLSYSLTSKFMHLTGRHIISSQDSFRGKVLASILEGDFDKCVTLVGYIYLGVSNKFEFFFRYADPYKRNFSAKINFCVN